MDGLRRAALALSAVPVRDCDWILSRLPEERRAQLRPLVSELRTLGLAPEPGLHQRLRDEEARRAVSALAAGDERLERAVKRLNDCPTAVIEQLLLGEPDVTIAALTDRFAWRWMDEVLRRLPPERRERVLRMKPGLTGMQDATWQALVQAVASRIDRLPIVPGELR
jgi:hypothetical protein